ncbi:tetratricopeptide repeat protein [Phormidium sp. CCY1219]|uniref:tetratricopeptide repeat protein n=1 Tax=Phormidium sp. CCY1219 TaxID=2886104 RepID=UPI002D1F30BE|nr:tetratricopeptide repeat protein [Phormidium sp. CCY1219]MEB3827581.1 tetratricopeptide repeat protein [Phormidium sp. CCY1219]
MVYSGKINILLYCVGGMIAMQREALAIGINRYPFLKDRQRKLTKHLTTPAGDAEAIARLLEKHGDFHVERFPKKWSEGAWQVDPQPRLRYPRQNWTVEHLQNAITQLFHPPKEDSPQTALLFFAGHGLRKRESGSEVFLATSDVVEEKGRLGISLQWLRELLENSPVRQQIVWLDCCFGGELFHFAEAELGINGETRDRFFITASRSDEPAHPEWSGEHGVLSGALLQALDPTQKADGLVTNYSLAHDIESYIESQRQSAQQGQCPVCKNWGGLITLTKTRENPDPPISSSYNPRDYQDFYGRQGELEQLETLVQASRVLVMWGESGVGKTYLAAQLAKQFNGRYKVCWLEDKEEGFSLDELLLQVNDFFKNNREYGFDNTYAEDKIKNIDKSNRLVEFLSQRESPYAFFLDGFQRAKHQEFLPLISRFTTTKSCHKIILIDHAPERSLGPLLAGQVKQFPVKGFQRSEAVEYIDRECQETGYCSPSDIDAIFEKTSGHPLAINLIIQYRRLLGVPMKTVLDRLVEYDQRYGKELSKRLLENVKVHLNEEEQQALMRLSVFRTPVQRSAWSYLDISEPVGDSLLHNRLLARMEGDRFQMHPLIAEFWRQEPSSDEMLTWRHKQAALYYWNLAIQGQLESLDRFIYLESYHHWRESRDEEKAAQVVNELVSRIHEKERLPSERLLGLTSWLLSLPDNVVKGKPWLLLEKGRKLEKQFRHQDAEKLFQQASDEFKGENPNPLGASVALFYVGKMRALREDPEAALQALHFVLDMAVQRDDIPMQIRTLGKMIGCYNDIGNRREAEEAATVAEKLADRIDDRLGLAWLLYRKGSIERHQSNYSKAEKLFGKSAESFEELKDVYRQSKSLSRLGICQKFQGKFEEAIVSLERAIKLKEAIRDRHGLARDRDYLADIYTILGNFSEAESLYIESLKIKEGDNNKSDPDLYGQIKTCNNLARLNLSKGRLDKAEHFIQESAKRIEKHNQEYSVNGAIGLNGARLMIQGDLEYSRGQYKRSLESYEEAATCFTSPHPEVHNSYSRVVWSRGRTYLAMANMTGAKEYLQQSLENFKTYKMEYHQALALTYLARCEVWEDSDRADACDREAREIASRINSNSLLAVCLETQALLAQHKLLPTLDQSIEETEKVIHPILQYFDEAKARCSEQQFLDIARLKNDKILWQLAVKYFCQKPIHPEDAYGLLKKEELAPDILRLELLNVKYLISSCPLSSWSNFIVHKLAEYARDVLCPLAVRFGFNQLREELEELAFAFLEPDDYEEIERRIKSRFSNQDCFLEKLTEELKDELEEATIDAELQARIKSNYSIYKKMKARQVSLEQILDIVGVRIITKTESECYQALAVVQKMGSFFQGEGILTESLRDYIKNPKKATGYQSIHVNIQYGEPEPQIVEFQIRTQTMHWAAEYGISVLGLDSSAHRHYKEPAHYARLSSQHDYEQAQRKRVHLSVECEADCVEKIGNLLQKGQLKLDRVVGVDRAENRRIILLLEMVGKRQNSSAYQPGEIEAATRKLVDRLTQINGEVKVKILNFQGQKRTSNIPLAEKQKIIQNLTEKSSQEENYIYVFTPKGDVKKILKAEELKKTTAEELKKTTAVDFAYKIHEEVGNHCTGAKVNGKMVKLHTPLQNGDIVEIITDKNGHPSLDWLKFVITPTAKSRIRRWYRRVHRQENIATGREKLQKELGKNGFTSLLESEEMQTVAKQCNYHSVDDLLAALGYGDLSLNSVVNRIREATQIQPTQPNGAETSDPQFPHSGTSGRRNTLDSSAIVGIEGMPYRLAGCCNPVPGQPIIGIVTRGGDRAIAIHTQACARAKNVSKEQVMPVEWNKEHNQKYTTWIEVEVIDRPGELNKIANILAEDNINIQNLRALDRRSDSGKATALIPLCIEVNDVKQLDRVLSRMKKLESCLSVKRQRVD